MVLPFLLSATVQTRVMYMAYGVVQMKYRARRAMAYMINAGVWLIDDECHLYVRRSCCIDAAMTATWRTYVIACGID